MSTGTSLGLFIRRTRNNKPNRREASSYTLEKTPIRTVGYVDSLIEAIREHCDGTRECLSKTVIAQLHFGKTDYAKAPDKGMLKVQAGKLFLPIVNHSTGLADAFIPVPAEGKSWEKKTPERADIMRAYTLGKERPYLMYCPPGDALADSLIEARLRLDGSRVVGSLIKYWERIKQYTTTRPQLVARLSVPNSFASSLLKEALADDAGEEQLALQA
jgi:hypothetical protein